MNNANTANTAETENKTSTDVQQAEAVKEYTDTANDEVITELAPPGESPKCPPGTQFNRATGECE